jgi:hypothetical protein
MDDVTIWLSVFDYVKPDFVPSSPTKVIQMLLKLT